jgi:shikimate kinase
MGKFQSNIILIGMPGAGKSTVGVILAKRTSRDFIDTDLLIQISQKRTLQDIVDKNGYTVLRNIEESVLLDLSVQNCVIATGGSAVYSGRAMAHLKSGGRAVFLETDLTVLKSRVHDFTTRGLAKRPNQSFADLYSERSALYADYADIVVKCADLTQDEVCSEIISRLEEHKSAD